MLESKSNVAIFKLYGQKNKKAVKKAVPIPKKKDKVSPEASKKDEGKQTNRLKAYHLSQKN